MIADDELLHISDILLQMSNNERLAEQNAYSLHVLQVQTSSY
jgi:hypothetical protein